MSLFKTNHVVLILDKAEILNSVSQDNVEVKKLL